MVFSSHSDATETLKLAGGGMQNDPFDRISEEVLIEAYRRIGVEISFTVLPPPRALRLSNEGILDGEMHRIHGIDEKFSNLVMIPVPINKIEALAFTKSKDITVRHIDDLKPYLIGIRRGVKFAEEMSQGMNIVKTGSTDQLFRMLDLGRLDVVISTRTAGLKMIKRLNLREIRVIEPPLVTKNLYHYLHNKHQSIVPRITTSLQTMENEKLIEKKYEQAMTDLLESTRNEGTK